MELYNSTVFQSDGHWKNPSERVPGTALRERERERDLLGTTVHNGGSRAASERERVEESLQVNQCLEVKVQTSRSILKVPRL
jgi:hypothetical protein